MKGFTLLEILLVVLIVAILVVFIFSLGLNFYKSQQLESYSQQILQALRRAQLKAMAVEADSSFGVYFDNLNKKYILFKGNSYNPGDPYNEEFDLPAIITISGPSGVIFSKLKGRPSFIGNITINSNGLTQSININAIGRINLAL